MYRTFSRQDLLRIGLSRRAIASALGCCLARVARGRYVAEGRCADPRHAAISRMTESDDIAFPNAAQGLRSRVEALDLRVRAFVAEHPHTPVTHLSAAIIHRLPFSEVPTMLVEVSRQRTPRRSNTLFARRRHIDPTDIQRVDGFLATSLPRTLLDVAADYPLHVSVPMIDFALAQGRLADDDLAAALERIKVPARRGRILTALSLCSALRESVAESVAAVRFHEFGIRGLTSQHVVLDPADGRFIARVDFFHEKTRTIIEIDGAGKYSSDGADPRSRFEDERRREYAIRNLGYTVFRIRWQDLWNPAVFDRIAEHIRRAPL